MSISLNDTLRKYNIKESDIIYMKKKYTMDYYVITSKGDWIFLDGVEMVDLCESSYTKEGSHSLIKRIILPESVSCIKDYAFRLCENLEYINFPKSIEFIGNDILNPKCPLLNNKPDGLVYFGDILYCYKGEIPENSSIVIKEGTRLIAGSAFNCCIGLESVKIPNGVESICESAFLECKGLKSISIPNSVKKIYDSTFEGCKSLTGITIPNSVEVIGADAFKDCSNLNSISIPNSVKVIGDSAFEDCKSLTGIVIPNSLEKLGKSVFLGCSSLSDVVLPDNKSISLHSFYDSKYYYNNLIEGFEIDNGVLKDYLGCDENIIIPDSVKVIDRFAFTNKTCVKSIKLSNSVKEIKTNAFYACTGLCSLYISASVEKIEPGIAISQEGELTIESIEVDENNKYYSSLDGNLYNKEKTRIIQYAVGKKDRFFSIPESVTSIEDEAFWSARNLTEVKIPNGVVTIGRDAFLDCYSLSKISIPDSVQEIGDQVFTCCSNLEIIEIGSGLQKTGSLYEECYEIKHVFIKDVAKYCSSDIDYPCNSYGYNLYLNGGLIKELVIPEGVSVIKSCAFCACDSIEKVILPNSLSKIEQSAFTGDKEGFKLDVYYNGKEEEWSKVEIEDDNDYLENAKVHFNYKSKQEKISACKEKVDISPNNDVLFKVSTLLCSRVPEKEILSKLKGENIPDKDIVESVFKLDNDSTMAESFCSKVIEPKVVELLKTGYSVGEVLNNMYKKYPRGLVNRSMVNVLCNEYLTY